MRAASARGRAAARRLRLGQRIQQGLRPSLEKGGAFYEQDLFGQKGGFEFKDILVGYREGQPCLTDGCAGTVRRIVQSGRSTYYCPDCQR